MVEVDRAGACAELDARGVERAGAAAAAPAAPPMLSVPIEPTWLAMVTMPPTETAPPFEIVSVPVLSPPT